MNPDPDQQLDLFGSDTGIMDQISLDLSDLSSGTMADTITVSAGAHTVPVYSVSTGFSDISIDWNTFKFDDLKVSNTLKVDGPGADVVINGESLVDTLRGIQDRLAILRPNPDLEQRWQQLRDLREEYQRLEQEILEKERAWAALQQAG
jgi:hypothetical protein